MYKVVESDLIGEISGFPIEVVQLMVEEQVLQGCNADVTVFQRQADVNSTGGGFDWAYSRQTTSIDPYFWSCVIRRKEWDTFFNYYPRKRDGYLNGCSWD